VSFPPDDRITSGASSGPSPVPPSRRAARWGLAACAAGALALRLASNGFGLPDTFEPDEPKMVNHALAFGLGDLNPHYFVYPAFQMYLLSGCYGALYLVLRGLGSVHSVLDYQLLFLSDPTVFYRVGRSLSALFGTAAVVCLFFLGRRLYGSVVVGLLAAIALAVHPIDVLHGHYVTADVPMTFFLLLGLWLLAPTLTAPSPRRGLLAGAAGGLATATKYSGLVFLAPLMAAHFLAGRRFTRPLVLGSLAVGLAGLATGFVLASPYSLLEWRATLDGMRLIFDVKHDGQFGIARGASWATYFVMAFLTSPLALVSLAGLAYALWRRLPADLLVLSMLVPYLLTVGSSQSHSDRYLVPAIPLLLLLGARVLAELPVRRTALGAGFALAALFSLSRSVAVDAALALPDTRQVAREWIEANVPDGSRLALEWGDDDTVRLAETAASLEEKIQRYEGGESATHHAPRQMAVALRLKQKAQEGRKTYRLVRLGDNLGNTLRRSRQDLDELHALGVSYVVTSSAALGDPDSAAFRRTYPDIASFYERLRREGELLKRFDAADGRRRGPRISIYRLAPPAGEASE
jgi:dolichyl-phosphate-mannose-protein mannosyltransferase